MKCLTVSPAYAWCIAMGLKPVETRKWQTTYRGPLAISAAAKVNMDHVRFLQSIGIQIPPVDALPRGKIIATCILRDIEPFTEAQEPQALCRWYHGYGWWLDDVKMLPIFVPVKGRLGLFEVVL